MIALMATAAAAQRWPQLAPSEPVNVTVTAGSHSATIRWEHAPLSAGGGLATNYAVLWQREGRATAELTESIVVGTPEYVLNNLRSGRSYGFRISAYNPLVCTGCPSHRPGARISRSQLLVRSCARVLVCAGYDVLDKAALHDAHRHSMRLGPRVRRARAAP